MSQQSTRIAGINGLRAVACLAVFFVHFQQITGVDASWGPVEVARLLGNGNTGVALFFVLSGFLLGIPFWTGKLTQSERTWLIPYARNRILRLLPAYYLCLTVLVVWQRMWEDQGDRLNALCHYCFVHNYSESMFYGISPHFWTIAVQAQFYVVLAVVFWSLSRLTRSTKTQVAAFCCLTVGAYLLHWLVMVNGDAVGSRLGLPQLITRC